MRWLIVPAAGAALLLASCASMQDATETTTVVDATDFMETEDETEEQTDIPPIPALTGDDPAARDAEIARFLAAPETVPPLVFVQYALALHEAGRHADAAVWHMRGMLRLEADIAFLESAAGATGLRRLLYAYTRQGAEVLPSAIPGDENEALRTLIEEAIAWESATPRRYDMFALVLHATDSDLAEAQVRTLGVDLSPDQRTVLANSARTGDRGIRRRGSAPSGA